jgi:branched-chain amino acid transport system substrate-binding protein
LALTACDNKKETAQANSKPVIKIGATLPLSGNLSYIGEGAKNALDMVMEKWQQKDTKYNYQIVYEDDLLKPQQAAINTQKLINMDKSNVVVSVFGVVDRPVDEIANQNKVISLSCSHGKDKFPEYGLNVGSQNEEVYQATLEQLKKMGVKKVALVGSHSAVSDVLLDYAAEHLPKEGIEVLANEKYAIGETDYRLSIQKLEQKNPDYYLIFGVEPMNSIFAKQYLEITGKNNLLSLGTFANIDLDVFPPIEGVLSVYMLRSADFEKMYSEKYHKRVETCAPQLYDGLDMIIQAFENTEQREGENIPNNTDILQAVKSFNSWDGVSGKMEIEANGIIRPNVDMRTYHNGKWVKVEE